jgi:hypothetical protein
MRRHGSSTAPRGQILIVTAVGMIVLIGIAALVVDIGMSWMLRRQEQNAADPAAIAAARWLKDPITGAATTNPPEMAADACYYVQENGFFVGDPGCSAALARGDLRVLSPPISGLMSGHPGHVQVIVRSSHPSFFGRIFGSSEAWVTTSAVAANTAGNSNSSSLVALQPVCSGGSAGTVTGGGSVKIYPAPGVTTQGGYVHVNSPCGTSTDDVCQNGSGSSALAISGGGTLITPYAYVTGSCSFNGSSSNSDPNGLFCDLAFSSTDCVDEDSVPLGDPLANLPEPRLADFPNGRCPNGGSSPIPSTSSSTTGCALTTSNCPPIAGVNTCVLPPGVYYGGWDVKNNVRVQLTDGMYILAGGGIKLTGTGTEITTVDSSTGIAARVTIFSTDGPACPSIGAQCQGSITFTARQIFKAKATNAATCAASTPSICPWKGILLWQDGSAHNPDAAVKLGGQASTILSGTIYAPKADVLINGGTSTTGCSTGPSASCLAIQIISYTWKIDGNALVEMPYDPSELYQLDQRGLVD